ncbi:MAG: hypothetical protein C0391_02485 [Anaerolinea sp.]|nr:hypothetical protein [Anaerolinea sp.]
MNHSSQAPSSEFSAYTRRRVQHWDEQAARQTHWKSAGGAYHHRLTELYRQFIPPGSRILELGSGTGDLIGALSPAHGVGIDFSPAMVSLAQSRHPEITFQLADAHSLEQLDGEFDYR